MAAMNSKRLLLASVGLLAGGFLMLETVWHGTAGVTASYPFSGAAVQFCGSGNGGLALAGVAALALGGLSLIGATVSAWIFERPKDVNARRLASQS